MTEETTTQGTTRQRRKRKWDQPAEALVSAAAAMPSLLPFTGALAGMGALPGVFPYVNYFPALSNNGGLSSSIQTASPATVQQNAAAIVQKFNQDLAAKGIVLQAKIQDELIAREITINDAEPGVRYRLTKRQTQEEIQLKTGAVVITRGRYRPPNGPAELEKPLYLHISAGVNLKDTAERIKAVDQAAAMVEDMLKQGQQTSGSFRSPSVGTVSNGNGPVLLTVNIFVDFEADPSFNLTGRIRGPNDQYINHIMHETGATVVLRGRGSGSKESSAEELPQPLHLYISSDNVKSLEDAKTLAENLLETIRADSFPFRLPPYQVPAPAAPSAPPSTIMGYPTPQPVPYQGSVVNQSQGPYRGYYPSVGVYPPPYPVSQAPFPSFPTAVPARLDQPVSTTMNPYTNMQPSNKVYGAVPPPTELLGDQSTGNSDAALEGSSERIGHVRLRERFSQSSNDSILSVPSPATFTPPDSAASRQIQAIALPSFHTPTVSKPNTSLVLHQHLNGTAPLQMSTSQIPQASSPLILGQSVSPAPSHAPVSIYTQPMTTSYSGYGGVYPDVPPLQQVVQALQRPPLPVSVKPLPNAAFLATLTKAQSSSFQDRNSEKPAQRRKFKEFPVSGKDSSVDEQQGRRGTFPSGPAASSQLEDPGPPSSNSMPPPPPRSMPPPPISFDPPKSYSSSAPGRASTPDPNRGIESGTVSAGFNGPDELAARHGTGLKLVEYGEEEDEPSTGEAALQTKPFANGKPFWAA